MSTRILTRGGFVKIPLEIPSQNDPKVRLYYLQDLTQEKIEKAKAALLQEIKKQRIYEGDIGKFEEEVNKKPYLLKQGETLELTEGKETQTPEKTLVHQIKVSQKASYIFEKAVKVGGNFNISGKHATTVININILQTPSKASGSSGRAVIEGSGSLKVLEEALRSHYKSYDKIPLLFDEDEKLPIQNYARLAIIGESERKEKQQDLNKKETKEGKPLHELSLNQKNPSNSRLFLNIKV